MKTNFEKIANYYASFDEWKRLDSPEGALEFQLTCEIILNTLKPGSSVLDLGGGPGRYTFFLADNGYRCHLADISIKNIEEAKRRLKEFSNAKNIDGMDVINAIDLTQYPDNSFDAVLAFGPFYHLTDREERKKCLSEIFRVTRSGGKALIAFIPLLSGMKGLIERSLLKPEQVNSETFRLALETGVFKNESDEGFQEGYYARSEDLVSEIEEAGLVVESKRSIRGLGVRLEKEVLSAPKHADAILQTITETAGRPEIIELCGHAIVISIKP